MKARTLLRALFVYWIFIILFFPIFWLLLTSFKTEVDAYAFPPRFFFEPTLGNYENALASDYVAHLVNSLVVVVGSVLVADLLGLPVAFYLSELYRAGRREGLFLWFLSTKFTPAVGVVIPIYVAFVRGHILDTRLGLLAVYVAMAMPLVVAVMRSFFLDVPGALIEAAVVDGAGFWTLFFRVLFPMVLPGLATISILALIFNWNEFLFALTLTGTRAGTLPVFLAGFMTSEGLFWGKISAAAMLGIAPVLLLGWLAQSRIVRGLTLGAIRE